MGIAVGLGVFDEHPMIGELLVARDVKAIENAFDSWPSQSGVDVVARYLGAGRDGVRNEIRAAAQECMERGHMKCGEALLLEFAVLDYRIVAQDKFGDRIGEVDALSQANVALDQGQLAALLRNDEIAGERSGAGTRASRDKQ